MEKFGWFVLKNIYNIEDTHKFKDGYMLYILEMKYLYEERMKQVIINRVDVLSGPLTWWRK